MSAPTLLPLPNITQALVNQTNGLMTTQWFNYVSQLNSAIQSLVAAGATTGSQPNPSTFTTGDLKPTLKAIADSGWVMMDDGTIGSSSSNATALADPSVQELFTLLFDNCTDLDVPLLTRAGAATTRAAQASASAAWAANCQMALPKMLGRAISAAGQGSGLTLRKLGSNTGSETHTMSVNELVPHSHGYQLLTSGVNAGGATADFTSSFVDTQSDTTGGGQAFSIMQPAAFVNIMVKL